MENARVKLHSVIGVFVAIVMIAGVEFARSQNVPTGSLIIPMDQTLAVGSGGQAQVLKAYGLVYKLLQSNVPVKWAYSTTKTHNGTDFSVSAGVTKILNGSTFGVAIAYKGGPFVIDAAHRTAATAAITAFGNGVTVHDVISPITVPVTQTLIFPPIALVHDTKSGNLTLITDVFTVAGIPSSAYHTNTTGIPDVSVLECYSIIMIPHENNLTAASVTNLKNFLDDGGNIYLQCEAIKNFETTKSGFVLTTAGIEDKGDETWIYPDAGARIHFGQFVGDCEKEGGAVDAWTLKSGSSYKPGAVPVVQRNTDVNWHKAMCIRKDNNASKGFAFYAGGHGFVDDPTKPDKIKTNLCRLTLNAFFAPFRRDDCGFLPVQLVEFTSTVVDDKVLLKWKTATEANNFGYEIQRSAYKGEWTEIAFIPGHGTVNSPRYYSFCDENAMNAGYHLRYRLKQIDRDGSYAYSPIVEAKFKAAAEDIAIIAAYPNPFNPSTVLTYYLPSENTVTLKIQDALGRDVMTLMENEQIPIGLHSVMFDAGNLPSGVYYAVLTAGSAKSVYKVVLNR